MYAGCASKPPNLISLNLENTKEIENNKKPLAVRIINQPKYSDIASCVELKNIDDVSRLLKTMKVIEIKSSAEIINLDLFELQY